MTKRAWVVVLAIFGVVLVVGGVLVGALSLTVTERGRSQCGTAFGDATASSAELAAPCAIVRGEAKTAGILAISVGVGFLLSSVAVGVSGVGNGAGRVERG